MRPMTLEDITDPELRAHVRMLIRITRDAGHEMSVDKAIEYSIYSGLKLIIGEEKALKYVAALYQPPDKQAIRIKLRKLYHAYKVVEPETSTHIKLENEIEYLNNVLEDKIICAYTPGEGCNQCKYKDICDLWEVI